MKQSYRVKCNVERNIERDDASFRACLCTLLLLLALFGIISLFLWRFEERTPASYKVLNHKPSSDSSSWFGKIIRNDTKSTLPPTPLVTASQEPETATTSAHVTNRSEQSTSSVQGDLSTVTLFGPAKTLETTESKTTEVAETSSADDASSTEIGESSTPSFTSLATETEATSSTKNVEKSTTENSRSTSETNEISNETMETFFYTNPKEDPPLSESSTFSSTKPSYEFSSRLQDTSTSKRFERILEIEEATELSTAEEEFEQPTEAGLKESPTTKAEITSKEHTELFTTEEEFEQSTEAGLKESPTTEAEITSKEHTELSTTEEESEQSTEAGLKESPTTEAEITSEEHSELSTTEEEFGQSTEAGFKESPTTKSEMTSEEHTELSTTEEESEQSTEASLKESLTTEAEMTSEEHFTTFVVETTKLRESLAFDATTPYSASEDAVTKTSTATSTTMRTTMTTPPLTCPMSSCPECPVVTCPTIPTTTVPTTTVKPEVPVCKSNQCYVTAARILSLVNVSVDPCEDFYSYACGGILNNPTLLESDLVSDVWKRIEKAVKNISSASPGSHKKLKNLYTGCVNYDELVPMEERKKQGRIVLDSVAKFADSSSTPENDFTDLLIRLFRLGSRPLLDLRLDVDSTNSSQFQLVVTAPDWVHSPFHDPTRQCQPAATPPELFTAYDDYKHCMGNFSEFIDTTQKALEFFGVFDYLPAYNASQLIQEIRMSMEFDVLELLREYPSPDVVNKDTQSKTYKLTPKIQLETQLPMISWSYLFSSLLNVEVSDATNIQVYFIEYIKKFFDQLQTKSARSVHNSLLAMLAHDLYTNLVLTHQSCDRERYCLRVTAHLMPVVASNLYLESFPAHEAKQLMKQVVLTYQQLEAAMEDKISKATWLDEKTSNEISKKLKFMSIQLPRKFNDTILDSSSGECSCEGRQYLEDSVCLLRQLQAQLYARYSLDPHSAHAMWPHFLTSFSTETAFIYGLNTFIIPMAVIWPVYDPQMPRHVVMATLGNLLARGIGHNFDHTGVKFVAGGKIGMMLSEATNPTYEAVVENSNMQFSWTKSYREDGKVYSYLLDPELTLNQRLSDMTAVNLSLSMVLDSTDTVLPWTPFSPAQTYFLALAQSFCSKKKMPEMFTTLYEGSSLLPSDRVFNLAANSEQFALAFRCPLGTTMNMASELKTRPFPTFDKEDLYVPDYS